MKIEIGESLMMSYLKHIKKCTFYQLNWKVSSNWDIIKENFKKVNLFMKKLLITKNLQEYLKSLI
jgi:hypothetical protein